MKKKKLGLIIVITAVLSSLLTVTGLGWLMGFTMAQAKDTARFFGAVQFIQRKYVKDVDYTQLMDGAINGMVKTLGDPHSIYLDQNMYKQLMEHTEGSFGGIGVFAIPEMGRFYRHVLIEKRYPHHGAVAFGHYGKALYDIFRYLGVKDIAFNQPKGMLYPTENPFA